MSKCLVVISRGKNKGRLCGDANKRCHHVDTICPLCGREFKMDASYMNHARKCVKDPAVEPVATSQVLSSTPVSVPAPAYPIPVRVQLKNPPSTAAPEANVTRTEFDQLKEQVQELQSKPHIVNYTIVIGDDFYADLKNKLGKEDAIAFISDSAVRGTPLDIVQRLYLDDVDPRDYPIACRDTDDFRYIDSRKQVVFDKGGTKIGKMIGSRIQDAMLRTSSDMIVDHVQQDVEITDEKFDRMMAVQRYVIPPNRVIAKDLAVLTTNPTHRLFELDGVGIRTEN